MIGINQPLLSDDHQPEVAQIRMPPPPGMPDQDKIRISVKPKNIFRTIEVFFEIAASNGIPEPDIGVGKPHVFQKGRLTRRMLPLELRFHPDGADGTFSPAHLENVNRAGYLVERALQKAGIVELSALST